MYLDKLYKYLVYNIFNDVDNPLFLNLKSLYIPQFRVIHIHKY